LDRPAITVRRHGVDRLEAGHVWVFRSDVIVPTDIQAGAEVRLLDERRRFLGTALYSSRSQIAVRFLSREDRPAEDILAARLALAVALRDKLYPGATAIRVVHSEGDGLPGLIVDRYGAVLSLQTLTQAMDGRQAWIVERLLALTGAASVVARNDVSTRRHEGLEETKSVLHGEPPGQIEYREGEIRLVADPMAGQKTGSFLDQRENHVLAGDLASGRALDCFSYAGGFALQLARHAASVTAVDSSERALDELRTNASLNALKNVTTHEANAFDYLRAQVGARERYDTIVLDPPAFAKNRQSIEPALRGYKEINLRALTLLNPGGLLVTCSCSFHVDEATFTAMLLAAAHDAGRQVQLLERRGAGKDHPELLGVPETKYLKCFFARVL
jgi:23S rRNA (cytosine1962-C5)-methyltransferase